MIKKSKGSAIALGTFDGVHLGHRMVLRECMTGDFTPVCITFKYPPKLNDNIIMDYNVKRDYILGMGFSEVVMQDFEKVKDIPYLDYINEICDEYDVQRIVCGFNFRFGRDRQGDTDFLRNYCTDNGIELVVVPPKMYENEVISSSLIRRLFGSGDFTKAVELLGHGYIYEGEVIDGDKRGRTIGFPTINQLLGTNLINLRHGVYKSKVYIGGKEYKSVTNVGIRPTFDLNEELSETYILNYEGDLYGSIVKVELLEFIREEKKFDSVDALIRQMNIDVNC